ncbi:YceI family protein [Terasakiella pusilla]|uniref:YceI family protein n=1 Tax=Terasakiella pusilla TaxID=64973 RepID=UPI003AA895AC
MLRLFTFLTTLLMATQVMAADWSVRKEDSKLGFFATQAGAEFEGAFKTFSSEIRFDVNDLAVSEVKITIDIASVDTQSADRDSNITTQDWFYVSEYPNAIFQTKTITKVGEGRYLAIADLTMRGVTKEVELPFTLMIDAGVAHAQGEVTVSRTAFGIGQGQWAANTVVGDDVRIFFDLKADAQ